jgi:hypothetical protein
VKYRFLILGLVLSFTFPVLAQADTSSVGDAGKAWEIPNDADRGQHIFVLNGTSFGNEVNRGSFLIQSDFVSGQMTDPTCAEFVESKCSTSNFQYRAVLKQCLDANSINCLADFGVIDSKGQKTSAVFQRYFPEKAQNEYTGDLKKNVPSGGAGSLYQIKSAPFTGGDQYYVEAVVTGAGSSQNNQAGIGDFGAFVFPVAKREVPEIGKDWPNSGISKNTHGKDGNPIGSYGYASPGLITGTSCMIMSTTEQACLERYGFPSNTTFYMTIRLKTEPSGWLHGRMSNPQIQISKSQGYSTIEIQADPIAVPVVYKMYRWDELPDGLKTKYNPTTGGFLPDSPLGSPASSCPGGRSGCNADPNQRNTILLPDPYSQSAFDQLRLWLPFIGDKAQAMYGNWSARTLSQSETVNANQCFTGGQGVTGIVTTNSSTYSPGPPYLNQLTNSLDYKVSAPHFATSGEVFKGSYDLLMRSDVARCVYGFTNAPISATISVSSSDGEASVATTIFNESAGWVHLRAAGFTFSSPTISVKIDQKSAPAAPVVVSPSAQSGAPTASAVKKISITCVKGKSTKVVTALKPICPSGYKKK